MKDTAYTEKFVFHIPTMAFVDGKLVDVPYTEMWASFIHRLNVRGMTSCYAGKVQAYYRGRKYDEIIITLYTTPEYKISALDAFIFSIQENAHAMKQEAYAYELNDVFHVLEL